MDGFTRNVLTRGAAGRIGGRGNRRGTGTVPSKREHVAGCRVLLVVDRGCPLFVGHCHIIRQRRVLVVDGPAPAGDVPTGTGRSRQLNELACNVRASGAAVRVCGESRGDGACARCVQCQLVTDWSVFFVEDDNRVRVCWHDGAIAAVVTNVIVGATPVGDMPTYLRKGVLKRN